MGKIKEKQMTRGVLLFAFNTPKVNYFKMAIAAAKRINHFLKLPVSLVTDDIQNYNGYEFDNIIYSESIKDNFKDQNPWYNKGRHQAFELSPYDETLLLDTDYVVNSNKLLQVFDYYTDFCCHNHTSYLLVPDANQECMGVHSYNALWATVLFFKKTKRVERIFECMKMIQDNYQFYGEIHGFYSFAFRNDYALAIASKIVNGQFNEPTDFIPYPLVHAGRDITVEKLYKKQFGTEYKVTITNHNDLKNKKEYIIIKDVDFHMIDKDNFMELFNE
jgi:hypothetical protein